MALEDDVAVLALVEGQLVLEAGAAAALDADAQAGGLGDLLLTGQELLDLLGTAVGERDSLGLIGDFVGHSFEKYSER